MMKTLALSAIGFYQRHLSPYKGFCCAYCAYTGNASCSVLGARAIRRYGVWDGLGVLQGRLQKCGIAYRRYAPPVPPAPPRLLTRKNQGGFCDVPCDCSFDVPAPSSDTCESASDCLDAKDCWDSWKKSSQRQEEEERIHIPPPSERRNVGT
ncbi:membrane protein insertion efficiency factor YidD [Massilia sp. DJPM01]|uniref:membrane protein insertion efficiency factor YidD n=1 Tax=Massilia sp. DJPM01 TaxID=3024404 RepID=UPI00259D393B|nr:membrane protein insertion efficiency factor YidD [Massilia sp. DJPM01]MDM5178982.1 membrane protein insertion efficiency factor YidD [Massilia sp. DJPM01]